MNTWIILLISEDTELADKWVAQIENLYQREEIKPVVSQLDESEKYLAQKTVALVCFALPTISPGKRLRQLASMMKFYKNDCELLVVHQGEDSQVLRAVRDCGGRLTRKQNDSKELLTLLSELVAKRTGTSAYRDLDRSIQVARLEERVVILQERLTEILGVISGLNDCLFGGPNHPGWDKRLDYLEEKAVEQNEKLDRIRTEQSENLTVFKNQIGFLAIASIGKFFFVESLRWSRENPFKVAGLIAAIASLVAALVFN